MSAEYRVELDLFAGPLDLLLYLVKRNEVDVCDVSLAKIATQFVTFLEVLQFVDLDLAGEFLVTASTLIEIKSRSVLPQDEPAAVEDAPADDLARSELVRRLLEYRKFKEAAAELQERASRWQERYPRLSVEQPVDGNDPSEDRIREVELWDLVSALGRVLQKKEIVGSASLQRDETPVAVLVGRVGERVRREGRVAFTECFEGIRERGRIVGVFLAVLELLRHHGFRADQPADYGEIWIEPPSDGSRSHEGGSG
ncbi:MAG: segregation/condensation protein A [Planctomycetota bacterium]|nr:segregation/condensation protein A [Planctomycetaceae bacterium]MDQ3332036.1 segregation/condensation protein A [Planctomycetota bacterium]